MASRRQLTLTLGPRTLAVSSRGGVQDQGSHAHVRVTASRDEESSTVRRGSNLTAAYSVMDHVEIAPRWRRRGLVASRRRVMTRHSHRALPETVSAHLSPSFEIVVVPYSWVLRNSKLHTRVSVKKSALGRRKVPTSSSLFFCLLHWPFAHHTRRTHIRRQPPSQHANLRQNSCVFFETDPSKAPRIIVASTTIVLGASVASELFPPRRLTIRAAPPPRSHGKDHHPRGGVLRHHRQRQG